MFVYLRVNFVVVTYKEGFLHVRVKAEKDFLLSQTHCQSRLRAWDAEWVKPVWILYSDQTDELMCFIYFYAWFILARNIFELRIIMNQKKYQPWQLGCLAFAPTAPALQALLQHLLSHQHGWAVSVARAPKKSPLNFYISFNFIREIKTDCDSLFI